MNDIFEPGSFKDPEGRVFLTNGQVYRTLDSGAAQRMKEFVEAGILQAFADKGLLIPTQLKTTDSERLDATQFGEHILHHERIEVVTYPFEWSFEMLRQAALTTLSLLEDCLARNLILKDATAYNVTLHGGKMVFFDTLSIDRYQPGSPWEGYAQFCREFLFPLMLTAHRGIEFQPWYRGFLDGISLGDFAQIMTWRDVFRSGVLRHVSLQWRLERSFGGKDVAVRTQFDKSTFSKDLIGANVRGLRKLIQSLKYRPAHSEWASYMAENTYTDTAMQAKAAFVAQAMSRIGPAKVVDLGGNTGDFSMIAAESARLVISIDIDPACIDVLYRRVRERGMTNIVPFVGNLLNPTPAMGWNLRQRRSLFDRIRGDAFLALALVHHIAIRGNVPLSAFVDQLREIAPAGVVEWVDKRDAMVQQMLRNRADVFAGYSWDHFQRLLQERFELAQVEESHEGARRLCLLLPKT